MSGSFTRAMQGGQQAPPAGPAAQGQSTVGQMGQAAATACGQLVQALRSVPGCDVAALEQAAAQLRQSLMAVMQAAAKGNGGMPQQ